MHKFLLYKKNINVHKYKIILFFICILSVFFFGKIALASSLISNQVKESSVNQRRFVDQEGGYELILENGWRTEVGDKEGKKETEIIFRDRSYALLKIKHEKTSQSDSLNSFIDHEIESELVFRPEYTLVTRERFVNPVAKGVLLQFSYKRAGKPSTGRYYYLQIDPETVWILRFTGEKAYLEPLRYQTDQLARTFKPLP